MSFSSILFPVIKNPICKHKKILFNKWKKKKQKNWSFIFQHWPWKGIANITTLSWEVSSGGVKGKHEWRRIYWSIITIYWIVGLFFLDFVYGGLFQNINFFKESKYDFIFMVHVLMIWIGQFFYKLHEFSTKYIILA